MGRVLKILLTPMGWFSTTVSIQTQSLALQIHITNTNQAAHN